MRVTIMILAAIFLLTALTACGDTGIPEDNPVNGTNTPADNNMPGNNANNNQSEPDIYTGDIDWWGYYETKIFDEYVYIHINNFNEESFRFEIYGENIEELAGVAVVWFDTPNKAEYMSITFTYSNDEITVDGSDYGIVDGTYTRYIGDAGGDFPDPVGYISDDSAGFHALSGHYVYDSDNTIVLALSEYGDGKFWADIRQHTIAFDVNLYWSDIISSPDEYLFSGWAEIDSNNQWLAVVESDGRNEKITLSLSEDYTQIDLFSNDGFEWSNVLGQYILIDLFNTPNDTGHGR